MRLTPPKQVTWWVTVILAVVALLIQLGSFSIPGLTIAPFWLMALAFAILAVATIVAGL